MSDRTTITVGFLIVLVGFFISLWNFMRSYRKAIKDDETEIANYNASLKGDIKELSDNVKELNTSILKLNFKTDGMCDQITNISLTIRSMRDDLDNLKEKQILMDARLQALEKEREG